MTMKVSPKVEEVLDRLAMMREGKFDLRWMQTNPAGWGTRATPSVDGLTVSDINVGQYGVVPDHGAAHGSMAPRGAFVPADTPALGSYRYNETLQEFFDEAARLETRFVGR
jgi:hypothetical protein